MSARAQSSFETTAPSLAVLELSSIARGLVVADALVKRAKVRIVKADPVTPGKFLLVFVGDEASVEESLNKGREAAGTTELDVLWLPYAHPALLPALDRVDTPPIEGSLGILEFATVAATLRAADTALKTANVALAALHWARGVGGKGYFVLTGEQDEVEAAMQAGLEAVEPSLRVGSELVARPHPEVDWVLSRL